MDILEKYLVLRKKFLGKYHERFSITSGEYLEEELRKIEMNFERFPRKF